MCPWLTPFLLLGLQSRHFPIYLFLRGNLSARLSLHRPPSETHSLGRLKLDLNTKCVILYAITEPKQCSRCVVDSTSNSKLTNPGLKSCCSHKMQSFCLLSILHLTHAWNEKYGKIMTKPGD